MLKFIVQWRMLCTPPCHCVYYVDRQCSKLLTCAENESEKRGRQKKKKRKKKYNPKRISTHHRKTNEKHAGKMSEKNEEKIWCFLRFINKNMLRVYGTCSHSPWWIYIFLLLFTFLPLSLSLSFSFAGFVSDLSPLLHSLSTYTHPHLHIFTFFCVRILFYYSMVYFIKKITLFSISIIVFVHVFPFLFKWYWIARSLCEYVVE